MENKHELKSPKCKRLPRVSVIVPAYNEEKTIARTIKSLLNLDYPKDKLEIIVVDDGSTDDTYKIAEKFKGIELFRKENEGKGVALNFALKRCKGEFVGALDADSFVEKDSLRNMVGFFEDEEVMAVTPSLKVYRPKKLLEKVQQIEYLIGVFLRKIFAFLGSIHVTPGPFTIYRKKFFDTYGGYATNNITEDIEIALRIQSKKFKIENSVDANVYTVAPYNFRVLLKQRVRWYLGFINNTLDYRDLFGIQHGNLGVFILPASFFSVALVIVSLFYFVYTFVTRTIIQNYLNISSINFDISKLFKFDFDIFYFDVSTIVILSFFSLLVGVFMIYVAKKISKEKSSIKVNYLFYLVMYWFLFGFWWITAFGYKILGKGVKWGNKTI
ncbi:MAG: glycosyltransferase [Candidatus Woesearchaeota archaeon]|jgi:cellulose synthase/poly-beta-1,6-N-acetylglucosamine synthase-like glycosyltransferase|nr:glycosyltransferase [Candidatus Woesearchaeota archaeon]MDP7610192.1 glycosyltransferase [Candidatus Woesearchaeota archaeon]|tara:strand:- start:2091 stop:3245 length:1155 start_codon:yes stop_codon:yes gene_type:complete